MHILSKITHWNRVGKKKADVKTVCNKSSRIETTRNTHTHTPLSTTINIIKPT